MTTKYRKKPVEVEARQLTKDTAHDLMNWMSKYTDGALYVNSEPAFMDGQRWGHVWMDIHTLEGTMRANEFDWVVKGVRDEIYPVRDDIFKATYEAVSE